MKVEGLRLEEFRLERSWSLGFVRGKSIDGAEATAAYRFTPLNDISSIVVVAEGKTYHGLFFLLRL